MQIDKTSLTLFIVILIIVGVIAYYVGASSGGISAPSKVETITISIPTTITTPITYTYTSVMTTSATSATPSFTYTIPQFTTQVTLNGGGSSFINPQMQSWISVFKDLTKGMVIINYQSIGSGAGQKGLLDGSLDFAGSDIPLTKDNYEKIKMSGRGFIQFPVIAGSVAIIYNIPEWDNQRCGPLRLSGEVVAKIYLGEIEYWDDPQIKSLQTPECQNILPHQKIIGVHRSDGSGTTALTTMWLSKTYPKWNQTVGYGLVVNWPIDQTGRGIGGKGSEGMTAAVKSTKYSIGYVEPNYAEREGIPIAALRNKDGYFVLPTNENVIEALKRGAKELPPPDQYWGDVPLLFIYQDGPKTYPIVGTPFIIVYTDLPKDKREAFKAFFIWVLTEGQNSRYILSGYIPLPPELAGKAIEYINTYMK